MLKTLKLSSKKKNSNSPVTNFFLNWKCAILNVVLRQFDLKKHYIFFELNTLRQTLLSNENFTDSTSYILQEKNSLTPTFSQR